MATARSAEAKLRACRSEYLASADAWDQRMLSPSPAPSSSTAATVGKASKSRRLERGDVLAKQSQRFRAIMTQRAAGVRCGRREAIASKTGDGGERGSYSLEAIRLQFNLFDTDGTGELDAEELVEAMAALGERGVTVGEAEAMIRLVDKDGNGVLSLDEFVFLMNQGAQRGGPLERAVDLVRARVREIDLGNLREVFASYDVDQSGEIDAAELASAMSAMSGEAVSIDKARALIAAADKDVNLPPLPLPYFFPTEKCLCLQITLRTTSVRTSGKFQAQLRRVRLLHEPCGAAG
jgi:Ca2+-binding EF-hand superfamily protein